MSGLDWRALERSTSGYTVIDVETTGLSPQKHDRIVEIGIVFVSDLGEVQDRWSTLVNPGRDVGPTRIHGITASDVLSAPTFAEIAPYVLRAIAGRTVVAHNASFDLRFLAYELQRAGVVLEDLPLRGVCTMQWASAFLTTHSRRLADCCAASGIELTDAHTAAADALATATLLTHYLQDSFLEPPWHEALVDTRGYIWPEFDGEYPQLRLVERGRVPAGREDAWLARIVSRMPRAGSVQTDAYLSTLEMALLDGVLAEHEKDQLVAVAEECGLTRGQVLDVHGAYLAAMAAVAWEDGVVTSNERSELTRVAGLLGLSNADVERALVDAESRGGSAEPALVLGTVGITWNAGDRIVFTGDMDRPREEWEAIARDLGLEPGGVTKRTALVVAADPNSLSGKAAKARTYGIPIITEAAFARLIGF